MANIDLGNLTRYDGKVKEYAEDKYLSKNTANWQMTEKAGAVTCYPVPDSSLEGTVEFKFKEILPTTSIKGPDNPSTIEGMSNININECGWNILKYENIYVSSGLTAIATINNDGSITLNGTFEGSGGFIYRDGPVGVYKEKVNLASPEYRTYLPQGIYRIGLLKESGSFTAINGNTNPYCFIRVNAATTKQLNILANSNYEDTTNTNIYDILAQWGVYTSDIISGKEFTVPEGGCYYSWCICISPNVSINNLKIRPYLYKVGVDTSGSPLVTRNTATISLGNIYYGGSVNLATGELTITHRGIVFNGTEEFSLVTYGIYYQYRLNIADYQAPSGDALAPMVGTEKCTHFIVQNTTNLSSQHVIAYGARIDFFTSQQSVETFKAWLASEYSAGHPVTVVYPLANPYTVQLDPAQIKSLTALDKNTPRLNTLYTDADSIQVGYQKHPARTAYELENAILALGGGE